MGSSKKTTVGYWYKALFHHALGKGPIDAFLEMRGGDRSAWKGALTSSGTININAPMLWGGEKDQGGIVGDLDVMFGEATQQPNSYLLANLGGQVSAWRGIATVVFKGGKYGAMNPYPQAASYKIRRITAGWDGACWYSAKAEIVMDDLREPITGGSGWVDRDTGLFYVGAYKAVSGFYSTFNGWFNGYIGGLRATVGVARYAQKSYSVPTALFGDALSDPYWGNVLFQLRMQGSNGSTSFVDDKGHVVTAYGGAQISTAQSPFGGSSGYFNGSDSYLTVNVGAAEMLGNSWTIDGWMRLADYDSTPNTYGNTLLSYGVVTTPAYESTLSVFGDSVRFDQQEAASTFSADAFQNIGPRAQIGQWAFVSICFDGVRHWLHVNGQLVTSPGTLRGMNPAHILYFSRTNSDMGGEPTANIDETSLSDAADVLASEGFGLCTTRSPASESVEEFEQRICKVIGGAFNRDPIDGRWHLDLARGDYVLADLPILADDDVIEFSEVPATLDGAVNSVSVKYFDPELRESITTAPVQARGLIAAFGTVHQTYDYPEIPTADLALRVALRELRATATPLHAFDLVTNRVSYGWRPNTYFRLQLPKRGIADMVCIVGAKQSGTLRSGAIRLSAVEDIYSMPESVFVSAEAGVDTASSENPMAILRQLAIELPYSEVVQLLSRADLSVLPTDAGFLAAVADDPQRSVDYTMMVDDGSGYRQAAVASWCPTATVVEAGSYTNTAFTLAGFVRLDQVEVGSAAVWGNEIVRVDALNPSTGAVTFGRGCSDTVPQTHAAGERIWFVTGDSAIDSVEYAGGETVAVKLLTNSGSQQLPISAAVSMPVVFANRQIRPYPPGGLKLNAVAYPAYISGVLALSWAHRDRVQQADQLVDTVAASIGPEAGTTYTLRLYGETDTLLRTETGLTGTSYTWTDEEADSGLTVPGATGNAYSTALLARSPTALYMMEEPGGTQMTDASPNANHGTYQNGALPSSPALITEGAQSLLATSNQYAKAPGAVAAALSGFSIVIALQWSHASNLVVAERNQNNGYSLQTLADGRLQVTSWNGAPFAYLQSTVALNDGMLHNIVLVLGATAATSYLFADGVDVTIRPGGNASPSYGATTVWDIGSRAGTLAFGGRLDGVAFVPSLLTVADAAAINSAARSAVARLNGRIRFELESVRDGLISYQRHDITVDRAGYGYQYGNYYGGP